MKANIILSLTCAHAGITTATTDVLDGRAANSSTDCPAIHIFGARETTVPPGFGTAVGLVTMVQQAFSGTSAEAIAYPACGGQASCGGVKYDASAAQGTAAILKAVNDFHARCPDTKNVIIGYSQGGQIADNALCGGSGTTLNGSALESVKAAVFMGDPHNVAGLPFNVGTCTASGFAARPAGFQCAPADTSRIQSYCDQADPYCCKGNNAATHQGYVKEYGPQALAFIKSKLV